LIHTKIPAIDLGPRDLLGQSPEHKMPLSSGSILLLVEKSAVTSLSQPAANMSGALAPDRDGGFP
jgi:hypothetical protein